jgi:3',5'-cyclic AMP phosphodiesterase CpdA
MLKICHLSDLHLCGQNKFERRTAKALYHALNMGVDHIVITGDIVHYPNRYDYRIARRLFQEFGLLNNQKLSLTIGNHEIYGGVQFLREMISFPLKSLKVDYKAKLSEFLDYFPEAFENTIKISDEFPFPFAKILGDWVLVGINSTTSYSISNPLASNGKVSEEQLKALETLLKNLECGNRRKIVMIHHHFCEFRELRVGNDLLNVRRIEMETLKLHNQKPLLAILADNGVELVLHGHVHKSIKYFKRGIQFSNAGGAIDGWNPHLLSVNLITIEGSTIEINIDSLSIYDEPVFEENYGQNIVPKYAS